MIKVAYQILDGLVYLDGLGTYRQYFVRTNLHIVFAFLLVF